MFGVSSEDLKEFQDCVARHRFASFEVVAEVSLTENAGVLRVEQEH